MSPVGGAGDAPSCDCQEAPREGHDAADDRPGGLVVVALLHLVERLLLGDQLVDLQLARLEEVQQVRHLGSVVGRCWLLLVAGGLTCAPSPLLLVAVGRSRMPLVAVSLSVRCHWRYLGYAPSGTSASVDDPVLTRARATWAHDLGSSWPRLAHHRRRWSAGLEIRAGVVRGCRGSPSRSSSGTPVCRTQLSIAERSWARR